MIDDSTLNDIMLIIATIIAASLAGRVFFYAIKNYMIKLKIITYLSYEMRYNLDILNNVKNYKSKAGNDIRYLNADLSFNFYNIAINSNKILTLNISQSKQIIILYDNFKYIQNKSDFIYLSDDKIELTKHQNELNARIALVKSVIPGIICCLEKFNKEDCAKNIDKSLKDSMDELFNNPHPRIID